MRIATILTGGVIFLGSLLGMFVLGRVLNPPAQQVFVAAVEILPGDAITPDKVRLVPARVPDVRPFVTAGEIDEFGYAQAVEPIHAGMFIPKAALSFSGNPAARERVSLSLADPELVAMTIPVNKLTSPPGIVPGDKVSLNVSVGSTAMMSGILSSGPSSSISGSPLSGVGAGQVSPFVTPIPSPTPEPRLSLPVTKNLVVSGRVLSVIYETPFSPAVVPGQANTDPRRGDIQALVVAVPRSVQEALAFSIANGEVRVAVLDPGAPDDLDATAGMDWDDLVAYFRWQRQEWLASEPALEQISPAGAAAILPTLVATHYPTPTPTPGGLQPSPSMIGSPTPSPTPAAP
jgi:hypothetical protein